MMRRRTFISSLLAAPAVWSARDALAQTPRDALVIAKSIDDIISLDPHECFEFSGSEVDCNVYEKLLTTPNAEPQRIVGELAESWSASPDGLTHTFVMKTGRKFASGNPVTAQDAEYSLRRAVTMNKTPGFILTQFGLNAQNAEQAIRATDARTLVIAITEQVSPSFFYYCLTANVGSIVDKAVVESHRTGDDWGNGWLKTNSAGSGPYVLRTWRASENVTIEANPNYPSRVKTRRVVIRHVPEPASQLLLLQRGDADVARNLGPDQLRGLMTDAAYKVQRARMSSINYLCFNMNHPELAKPQVRQALKWAIDYDGIQRNIVSTTYDPHQAFLPIGFLGALEDRPFRFDPDKAKDLLRQAGVPSGFSLALDHYNAAPWSDIAQAMQATMAQVGITVSLIPGEQRQVITKQRARQHQLLLQRWGSDYMDPHSNAEAFAYNPDNSDGARSKTLAWRNSWAPAMTDEVIAASREVNQEQRARLYLDMQRRHQMDSPFAVLLQQIEVAARRANVDELDIGPMNDRIYYSQVGKA